VKATGRSQIDRTKRQEGDASSNGGEHGGELKGYRERGFAEQKGSDFAGMAEVGGETSLEGAREMRRERRV